MIAWFLKKISILEILNLYFFTTCHLNFIYYSIFQIFDKNSGTNSRPANALYLVYVYPNGNMFIIMATDDDNDDDDDDDDDDELFLWRVWTTKRVKPYFQARALQISDTPLAGFLPRFFELQKDQSKSLKNRGFEKLKFF